MKLCWTTDPPTEPGYYWIFTGSGRIDIVNVYREPKDGSLETDGVPVRWKRRWRWAGPIEEPSGKIPPTSPGLDLGSL